VLITAEPGTISNVQLGLFSPQLPEAARLDVTLARIRGIVGDENVGRAVLTDTHQPDGFRLEQFTITPGSASITPYKQTHLAIRKIRSAENISVTAQNQQPKALSFRNKRYVVEYSYGPWLTSGDWWNSNLWGLEQWDIEARAHDNTLLRCCVVRYQGEDHWRIAALYD
jgi:protein ImuB